MKILANLCQKTSPIFFFWKPIFETTNYEQIMTIFLHKVDMTKFEDG